MKRTVEAIELDGVVVGHRVTVGDAVEGSGDKPALEPSTAEPTQ